MQNDECSSNLSFLDHGASNRGAVPVRSNDDVLLLETSKGGIVGRSAAVPLSLKTIIV